VKYTVAIKAQYPVRAKIFSSLTREKAVKIIIEYEAKARRCALLREGKHFEYETI